MIGGGGAATVDSHLYKATRGEWIDWGGIGREWGNKEKGSCRSNGSEWKEYDNKNRGSTYQGD